jgi:hypothetical protein
MPNLGREASFVEQMVRALIKLQAINYSATTRRFG